MGRTQYVIALAALFLGLVHSWDIAVSVGNQLEFYTDGTKINTVNVKPHNLTAITYDEVHNMILFVDKQGDNAAICGYSLSSKDIRCFVTRYSSNIHDLAFDPATEKLFFTDYKDKSINWISLRNEGSYYSGHGNLLIKMDDRTPSDIAVDSCTGFIYWTNTQQRRRGNYMERAKFNGSERYVVDRKAPINSFALDLQTQKTYFFTGLTHNLLNKVDLRVNNIMENKKKIFLNKPRSAQELTVSKDYLYWTQSCATENTVWQILKNASLSSSEKPKVIKFSKAHKLSIAANYKIKDQVHGLQDCEALARLIPILEREQTTELNWYTENTETFDLTSTTDADWTTESIETETESTSASAAELDWTTDSTVTTDLGSTTDTDWTTESTETESESTSASAAELDWYIDSTETSDLTSTTYADWTTDSTVRTDLGSTTDADWTTESIETETESTSASAAELDWTTHSTETTDLGSQHISSRCQVSACHNYCFQGICSLNEEGQPKCSCNAGYSGARCEVYACHGYCQNSGACSLNQKGGPVCQCVGHHEGTRCEAVKKYSFSYATPQVYSANRNLTLADLVTNWRKPAVKVSVVVEV